MNEKLKKPYYAADPSRPLLQTKSLILSFELGKLPKLNKIQFSN